MKIVAEFRDDKAAKYVQNAFKLINGIRLSQKNTIVSDKLIAAQFLIDSAEQFYRDLDANLKLQKEADERKLADEATASAKSKSDTSGEQSGAAGNADTEALAKPKSSTRARKPKK